MDYIARAVTADGLVRMYACTTKDTVAEAARIHNTSATATAALGRTLSAAAMLGAMVKDEESKITVRLNGGGPIGTICALTDSSAMVRGYVDNPSADPESRPDGHLDVAAAVGTNGELTVIRDYALKAPYAGSVPLATGEIGDDFTKFFAMSEQIPSAVGLGVLIDKDLSVKAAGGFILQLMPGAGEEHIKDAEESIKKLGSVTEVLSEGATPEELLERLTQNQTLLFYDNVKTGYKCTCSRERMERALISIGKAELSEILSVDKKAELTCQFCRKSYNFSESELKELLKKSK